MVLHILYLVFQLRENERVNRAAVHRLHFIGWNDKMFYDWLSVMKHLTLSWRRCHLDFVIFIREILWALTLGIVKWKILTVIFEKFSIINMRDDVFCKSYWNISRNGGFFLEIKRESIRPNPSLWKCLPNTHLDLYRWWFLRLSLTILFCFFRFPWMTCSDIPPICAPKHRYEAVFVARIETQRQVATVNGKGKSSSRSGNFILRQGKLTCWRKVRENLK